MTTESSVRIEKLGIDNYATWKRQMKFLLKSKKLWTVIEKADATGTETRSSSKDATDKSDEALGLIGLHVENHLLRDVDEADNAKELWERLEQTFEARDTTRPFSFFFFLGWRAIHYKIAMKETTGVHT